ncbi:MAG: TetR/AcrR family transcriptional regulator [Acutalibacteraceae bacterium]
MEESDYFEALREKLIIAGADEIEKHGVSDFSLRRVASACGASCAAPYKHFKSKDEFVAEVAKYISGKWELLRDQIEKSYDDKKTRIVELCVANVKFRVSNPLYGKISSFDSSPTDFIRSEIGWYCSSHPEIDEKSAAFTVSALVCGTASLILSGEVENSANTFSLLRERISSEL